MPSKVAGRLRFYLQEWKKITSDFEVLDTVRGMHIPFINQVPKQVQIPLQIPMQKDQSAAVDMEVQNLLEKGVVVPTTWTGDDYFSTVFTRPKSSGGYRMILNLSKLNEHIEYQHFKMDTVETAIALMTPFAYMGSLDIRDAYYSVHLSVDHAKYFKFQWNGELYCFVAMANGVSCGPRKFTKLLKPVFAKLREMAYIFIGYIDDSWTMNNDKHVCRQGLIEGYELFTRLGFIMNDEKSVMEPTQVIEFLGLILDSIKMMVFLTQKKSRKIKKLCKSLIGKTVVSIRDLAGVIGNVVAALPAAQYGQMHYRHMERCKIQALQLNGWDWDGPCTLGKLEKSEMQWWIDNVDDIYKPILQGPIESTIFTDASGYAWGCSYQAEFAQGFFSHTEVDFCINTKELLAIKYALRCFAPDLQGKHVLVQSDNVTAIKYVRDMGGTDHGLRNQIALDIWNWAIEHSVWLSITHIAGVDNVKADDASRSMYKPNTEWALKQTCFEKLARKLGPVDVDLFASYLNHKLQKYVSWKRDPFACHIDAFTMSWAGINAYIFPPFSLISKVLAKVQIDQPRNVLLIVPQWRTQPWWPIVTSLAKSTIEIDNQFVFNSVPNSSLKKQGGQGAPKLPNTHFLAVKL